MTFWWIIIGIIAVVLLLAWISDRRRRGQIGDLAPRVRHRRATAEGQVAPYEHGTAGPTESLN